MIKKNKGTKKYKKYFILGFVLLNLLFMALPAIAGPFSVPDTDKSKQIFMDTLFGPLVNGSSGSELSGVITIFNQAMLFVGGILVTYTLLASTIHTAHDGEVLGKKWSSAVVPLRTAMGAAAILPVLPGGFCFAQGAVIWLAMQGIGLADRLVDAYIGDGTGLVAGDALYAPPSAKRNIRALVGGMLVSNTCLAAIDGGVRSIDQNGKITTGFNLFMGMHDVRKTALGGAYQIDYGTAMNPSICGSVTLLDPSPRNYGATFTDGNYLHPSQSLGKDNEYNDFFDMGNFAKELGDVNIQELKAVNDKLKPLGKKIYEANDKNNDLATTVRLKLDELTKEWNGKLMSKAQSIYANNVNTKVLDKIKSDGWLLFGAWYMNTAKTQDAISKAMSNIPSGTVPPSFVAGKGFFHRLANSFSGLFAGVNASKVGPAVNRAQEFVKPTTMPGGAVEEHGEASNTITAKIVGWFINGDGIGIGVNQFGASNKDLMDQNPVLMARNLGQKMVSVGWTAFGAATLAGSLSSVEGSFLGFGGSGGGGFSNMIAPMMTALAGTIIVSGATLSTYIPMLPYILWLGCALGWSILLIEAVIAAPLWAVVHLAPDGDGFVGRGGQGYMLVLSLVLRPGLMVLGFIASIILMKPLGVLVNSTFMGAFVNGVNPSFFGVTQMIMGCVIYSVVMIGIITKVFSLVHVIPDKILRWIGGGAADLGESAGQLERHTGAKIVAGAMVGKQLGEGMTEAGRRAGQAGREKRLRADEGARNSDSQAQETYSRANDELNQNENSMDDSVVQARNSASQGNEAGLKHAEGKASSGMAKNLRQSLATAKAAARSASAHGKVPGADPRDVTKGQQADDFLSRAGNVDSNNHGAIESFFKSEGKNPSNRGTNWGRHMQESLSNRERTATALSEIRSNFQRGNTSGSSESSDIEDDA